MDRTTYYLILRSQAFKNLEREELIFGDNRIVSMSNLSSLAGKQKHWLQGTLILMVFEIKPLAATEVCLVHQWQTVVPQQHLAES